LRSLRPFFAHKDWIALGLARNIHYALAGIASQRGIKRPLINGKLRKGRAADADYVDCDTA
jgi:hypothetical protein